MNRRRFHIYVSLPGCVTGATSEALSQLARQHSLLLVTRLRIWNEYAAASRTLRAYLDANVAQPQVVAPLICESLLHKLRQLQTPQAQATTPYRGLLLLGVGADGGGPHEHRMVCACFALADATTPVYEIATAAHLEAAAASEATTIEYAGLPRLCSAGAAVADLPPALEICAWKDALVLQRCAELSENTRTGRSFVGMHAVPLLSEADAMEHFQREPYVVSPKRDGERRLLYLATDYVAYSITRNTRVIPIVFWQHPQTSSSISYAAGRAWTPESLLDVEIIDGADDRLRRIVVLDVLAWGGVCLRRRPLFDRLGVNGIQDWLRYYGAGTGAQLVELQRYLPLEDLEAAMTSIVEPIVSRATASMEATLGPVDGLMFTPVQAEYRLGRSNTLLKWKEPEACTADFRYDPSTDRFTVLADDGSGAEEEIATDSGWVKCGGGGERPSAPGIWECRWSETAATWIAVKPRTDKSHPNTAAAVRSLALLSSTVGQFTGAQLIDVLRRRRRVFPAKK